MVGRSLTHRCRVDQIRRQWIRAILMLQSGCAVRARAWSPRLLGVHGPGDTALLLHWRAVSQPPSPSFFPRPNGLRFYYHSRPYYAQSCVCVCVCAQTVVYACNQDNPRSCRADSLYDEKDAIIVVVTTTIRLRFDGRSTGVRQFIKNHYCFNDVQRAQRQKYSKCTHFEHILVFNTFAY